MSPVPGWPNRSAAGGLLHCSDGVGNPRFGYINVSAEPGQAPRHLLGQPFLLPAATIGRGTLIGYKRATSDRVCDGPARKGGPADSYICRAWRALGRSHASPVST